MGLVNLSHCQSIPNWICNILLCQLFLHIHLTDKTIIKLMQPAPRNSLAEQVEMKPLFFFLFFFCQARLQNHMSDKCWMRPGPGQQSVHPVRLGVQTLCFQIGITALRKMNFNGNTISFQVNLHVPLQCVHSGSDGVQR